MLQKICLPEKIFRVIFISWFLLLYGCRPHVEIRSVAEEYHFSTGADLSVRMDKLDTTARTATPKIFVSKPNSDYSNWEPLTSFVHISDVQIRDFGIVLHSKEQEKINDWLSGGAIRDERLDKNDEYPLLALIEALNRNSLDECITANYDIENCPAFIIHTGDSVDASSTGELLQFLTIMNRSYLPWYNAIGNHDIFLFGIFSERNLSSDQLITNLAFINSRERFIEAHGKRGKTLFLASPNENAFEHRPTEYSSELLAASQYHGFDFNLGDTFKSYYSFALETKPKLRIIVLDTVALDTDTQILGDVQSPMHGALKRDIDNNQFQWLQRNIERAVDKDEYILVFGHHPLNSNSSEIMYNDSTLPGQKSLREYLLEKHRVLGYFSGHTHVPSIKVTKRSDGTYFAEVTAPSYHEYPQLAFLITILRKDNALGLTIRPLQAKVEGTEGLATHLQAACLGAKAEANSRQAVIKSDRTCGHKPGQTEISRFIAPVALGLRESDSSSIVRPRFWHPILLKRVEIQPTKKTDIQELLTGIKEVTDLEIVFSNIDDSINNNIVVLPNGIKGPVGPVILSIFSQCKDLSDKKFHVIFNENDKKVNIVRY